MKSLIFGHCKFCKLINNFTQFILNVIPSNSNIHKGLRGFFEFQFDFLILYIKLINNRLLENTNKSIFYKGLRGF